MMKRSAAWAAWLLATSLGAIGAMGPAAMAQQTPASTQAASAEEAAAIVSATGPSQEVRSLRDIAIHQTERDSAGLAFRAERDSPPLPRDFVQQPPLIPHTVRGYEVTVNFNKCMDCHSWSRAREAGATKISLTHFRDRDGRELSSVSPRRYFCLQCHVPQTEAQPLVENTFRPAAALK